MKILQRNMAPAFYPLVIGGTLDDLGWMAKFGSRADGRVTHLNMFDNQWVRTFTKDSNYKDGTVSRDDWFRLFSGTSHVELIEEPSIHHLTEHYACRIHDLIVVNTHPYKCIAVLDMALAIDNLIPGGRMLINGLQQWPVKESYMIFGGMFSHRIRVEEYMDSCVLLKVDS